MKKAILLHLARKSSEGLSYQEKQKWKKRLKIMAVFLVVLTVSVGGLAVWGAVKVVNYAVASADSLVVPSQPLEQGKEKLMQMTSQPLVSQKCLDQAMNLLSPTIWLTVPIAKNVESLTQACSSK